MGAENSVLDGCEWGETASTAFLRIQNGTLSDGSDVSVFTTNTNSKQQIRLLRKLAKQLRSIHHPSILHYVAYEDGVDGPGIVTEQVIPLTNLIDKMSAIEICSGVHTVLDGLAFLHDKVGLCHNNVCLQSVYVCGDGSWRLGGLEHACRFAEATAVHLEASRAYRQEAAIAPEEKQGRWAPGDQPGHARDVYAFAVMADELLEKLGDLGDMTKTFELRIQDECLSADPKDRPTMQSLRTDRLFTTDFLEIAYFLKNIALQPDDKRRQFFRELLPKLLALPEDLVGHRLVPLLLSRFVLLDQSAVTYILPHLLTPGPDDATGCEETTSLFSESLYSRFIIPTLVKIFTVHDHHIRMILLRYFHTYVHLISRDDLELDVFPQVLLGLRDTSDALAAASLRALAHLVPILGRDFVIGGKSKKYFKESMPKMPAPEPTMNNKLSNVQGIMGRKPLLKDLAVYSKGNKDTGMKASEIVDTTEKKESKAASREGGKETGRKWKERECRKQEMRQRREERRRAREAKTLDAENVQPEAIQTHVAAVNSSTVGEQTPNTNASAHNRESEIFKSTNISNADGNHVMCNTNTDWADDEHAQSDNESDWSIESANSAVNVPEKDDWSDWDDKGGNSDISDEIEKELHNMPSTVQYRSEHKKPHPVTHSTEDKGAHISKASDKLTGTQGNIENISSVSPHSTILPSKTKQSLPKSNPARKVPISMTTNQHPWENLDIKNITISVDRSTSSEFDFFVDMTPKFEPTSKELEIGKMSENMYDMNRNPSDFQLERVQNSPKSPVEKSSFGASHMTYKGHMSEVNTSTDGPGSTITFGVVDNTAEVPADGWGEDFDDWGNDNS